MRRRTFDIILSVGGFVAAALFAVLGIVLASEAAFARDYVKQQLGEQRIIFSTEDSLTPEEKDWKPGSICLIENAGKLMETGRQAECYANYFIAMHMRRSAAQAKQGWDGETYATMGSVQRTIRSEIQAVKDAGGDQAKAADLQKKLDAATALRSTFQTGETLRAMLLTTYGFSIFGEKADLAAKIAFGLSGVLIILSVAGLIHALVTPRSARIGGLVTSERGDLPTGRA